MDYELREKFKIDDDIKVSDLPKTIRHRIHKDLTELLPELIEFIENDKEGNYPGIRSEEWPVSYVFDGETFIVLLSILKEDYKTVEKVMAFKFPKDEMDKLLEENQNE